MDIPTITADIQKLLDETMAKDAAQDAALLAALNAEITKLKADLAACQGDVDPPPPPPPPPPPTTAFPDASNTGVPKGTVLTASGAITTTKAGQIIEGLDIKGSVKIAHDNVTLRNSKITSGAYFVVDAKGRKGFVMQDCEVIGSGTAGANGVNGYGKFTRLNIHGFENDFNITDGSEGGGIYDCYLWGLKAANSPSGPPHYDTIQIDGGLSNFEIIHNTIINEFGQTSTIMIDNYWGSISNILVDNNRLIGGGYTVYSDGNFSGGSISNVKFTNNRMKAGQYGYKLIRNNSAVWTGNVDDVTGKPI